MSDWTEGYVGDLDYTYGYYVELDPVRARLALLYAGYAAPETVTACELGFGQGLTVNLQAAASGAQWFGTDFSPAQAAFARDLAATSGAGAKLYDDSFEQFCSRSDLPDFDFIALHGIWSWINDSNRHIIVDFVRRKLRPGGVLYMGYNTMPGWAPIVPLRHLMKEHTKRMAHGSGTLARVTESLEFCESLFGVQPLYAQVGPVVTDRIKNLKQQNPSYLAHEYFNDDWHPMSFAEVSEWLAPAKVTHACSALLLEHIPAVNLSAEQQAFLAKIPDPIFRETVRDFITNQQFRRDYWVKGARKLTPLDQLEALRKVRVLLNDFPERIVLTARGTHGEAKLSEAVYRPVMESLASFKPKTLGQIEADVAKHGINMAKICEVIMVLGSKGAVTTAQDDAAITAAKARTQKLNLEIMARSRSNLELRYLASPVTGGGINVGRFDQLFLLARTLGHKGPQAWAEYVHSVLWMQGQKILADDNRVLETKEDNLAETVKRAQEFERVYLPRLKALGIAE